MDQIRIIGGKPLQGKVRVSGAKNAALPILFSTLLTEKKCHLGNVPSLMDIDSTCRLLKELGVSQDTSRLQSEGVVEVDASKVSSHEAPYELVRKMRASTLTMGPLLARFGEARVSLPGGCAIGARPIDYHLKGFEKLGAEIRLEGGYVHARAKKLVGDRIVLEFPSVGATENLMMAAALAKGETVIENAAREPEIVCLAEALRKMGAPVSGDGTEVIHVQGREALSGCEHDIIGDRIEAGTFLCAALATGGSVKVLGIDPEFLDAVLEKLEAAGASIEREENSIQLTANGRPKAVDLVTQPHPGFPTDMQAQFMAVLSIADGASVITESIFENRFMHVPELTRLGADIKISAKNAMVRGVRSLKGAPLMATDLRASASLVVAGLCAEGETLINRVYHLDRGYQSIEKKLKALGAQIERLES